MTQLTLVLGGARSGKSRYAEQLMTAHPGPWTYIATADPLDDEMQRRIDDHRSARAVGWHTVDAPVQLGGAIMAATGPVLVDCLTLWLSNLLMAGEDVEHAIQGLEAALALRAAPTALVASEVGLGIVPDNSLARRFRDEAGLLHQRLAARADSVVMVMAGLPAILK